MTVTSRIRVAVCLGALLLVAGTAVRARLLANAGASPTERITLVPGVLLGGVVQAIARSEAIELVDGAGSRSLRFGEEEQVAGATLRAERAPAPEVEVLRRPFAVYAHATRGFARIDFGPDPLGRGDGVRDRVVVPAMGRSSGWFSLRPPRAQAGARFLPEDRGGILLAERDDLIVRQGGAVVRPAIGASVPVRSGFVIEVEGGDVALCVRWEDALRAEAVLGADGRPAGSRDVAQVELVVTTRSLTEAAGALLTVSGSAGDEPLSLRIPEGGRRALLGSLDRLTPHRGSVLPTVAPNEQLEAAVSRGLAQGWIAIDRSAVSAAVPADATGDGPRSDLGWPLARSIVTLLDDYAHDRAPLALRLGPGLDATAARCTTTDGHHVSLRRDEATDSWVPGDRPRAGQPVECRVPGDGATTWIEAAVPARWRPSDRAPWIELPATLGVFERHLIPGGDLVIVELDGAPELDATERLAVSIGGAPAGTKLQSVEFGARAFAGWDSRSGDEVAAQAFTRALGDGWAAGAPAPPARREEPRSIFLRVPILARSAGWLALDVTHPGAVRGALWNGAALSTMPAPDAQGRRRLSLPLVPGRNLLALHVERPASAPSIDAGGARFATEDDGRIVGLAAHVADRRARPAVGSVAGPALVDRDGRDAPALLVEAGLPGLPNGTRWWLAPAVGRPGAAALLRASGGDAPRPCLDALGETRSAVLALGPSGAGCLESDAEAALVFELRVDAGGDVTLQAAEPLTLWTAEGAALELAANESRPWPEGARLGVPGSSLRLRRPLHAEEAGFRAALPGALPADGVSTLDDDLSASAALALRTHLAAHPSADPSDPHPLAGALLAMDAVTGEILACATVARGGVPASFVADACWRDFDLAPGSTFKLATAAAALRLHDPEIDGMLDGALPLGLRRSASTGSLDSATLPVLPRGAGPDRPLSTRLRNFRGHTMPADLDLAGAIASSSNTWFGYLGLLLHRPLREGHLGAAIVDGEARERAWPLRTVARVAGFGVELDLGLGMHGTGGLLPALAADTDALIAARSVGQGDVRATPLGIALLVAAIASDGSVPTPSLALRAANLPSPRSLLLSPDAAGRLREALALVVRKGTAAAAFADNPDRALLIGKTGSAQRVDALGLPRTDSWFAGAVLPSTNEAPVVIVAVLPGAGLGAQHAAEVVDQFSRHLIAARGWTSVGPLAAR